MRRENKNSGFTITEIIIATGVFATVLVALMSIFVFTLRINRRSDALRQASQGARNFVEFLVKEVRNGHIDYGVQNGTIPLPEVAPCPFPVNAGEVTTQKYGRMGNDGITDWAVGIVNIDSDRECFYWSRSNGDGTKPVDGNYSAFNSLYLRKDGVSQVQKLNPDNFTIDVLRFYVRPNRDPYTTSPPKIQPSLTMVMQFTVTLSTGEKVIVPYQTTISTNNYDIPAK